MKKIKILILILLPLFSCNLEEQMEKMNKMNTKLENEFGHNDINCYYHWGSEEEDNYFQISFYNYDMSSKTHSELEKLAKKVEKFFKKQNTDFKNLEYIEVRFTKEDRSNAESFVSFK